MPLKKKKIKKGTLENELENQNALIEVLTKDKKEKTYKPMKVGEVRSSTTHDESGELKVKKHKSWKEHNAWLDTFRAKIITGKGDK